MPVLDAAAVECRVLTFKEGALSALAHDLELKVTRLTFELGPLGVETKVSARFAADSLVVLHAMKDGRPTTQLSSSDRRKIEHTLVTEVLDVRRHPEIRFEGVATAADGREAPLADDFRVTGQLTLQGRTRPLTAQLRRQGAGLVSELTLHQPDFGIQPYSALLGTLKLRPDVKVRLSLPAWPPPAS